MSLTETEVRTAVETAVEYIIRRCDPETERDNLIEDIDESCDALWSELVKPGRITEYTLDDLVETLPDCATIIKVAEQDAWLPDDEGLWEGLIYAVVPTIAYFSLTNLFYSAFEKAGIDTNADMPFALKPGTTG